MKTLEQIIIFFCTKAKFVSEKKTTFEIFIYITFVFPLTVEMNKSCDLFQYVNYGRSVMWCLFPFL